MQRLLANHFGAAHPGAGVRRCASWPRCSPPTRQPSTRRR